MRNLDLATIKMLRLVQKKITAEGYCTIDTEALINYYKKSELYTKTEINELISSVPKFSVEFVTEKPTTDIKANTFYLVPKNAPESYDVYEEWIYINETWEKIGTTQIDLSEYDKSSVVTEKIVALKNELEQKINQNSTDIQTNANNIETNKQNIASNTAEIASLKMKNSANETNISAIDARVSNNEESISSLERSLEETDANVNALESEHESISQDIQKLSQDITSQNETISTLKSSIENNSTDIKVLENESHTHANKETLDSIDQSKVQEWNAKQDALEYDETPTKDSKKVMTSGAIYTALASVGGGQFKRLTYNFSVDDDGWYIVNQGDWGEKKVLAGGVENHRPWNIEEIQGFMRHGIGSNEYCCLEMDASLISGNYVISDVYFSNKRPVLYFYKYEGTDSFVKLPYIELGLEFEVVAENCFLDNTTLETIYITDYYTTIKSNAFSGCSALTTIYIGKGITTIEENAFLNCTAVTDIYYSGTESEWGNVQVAETGNEIVTTATIHYLYSEDENVEDIQHPLTEENVTTEYTWWISEEENNEYEGQISEAGISINAKTLKIENTFPFSGFFNVIVDTSISE